MHTICPQIPRSVSAQAWLRLHAGAGIVCVIVADWLFFRHTVGISFALFLTSLALICAFVNPLRAKSKDIKLAVGILAAGLATSVYDVNVLSFSFGCAALALYSQILSGARIGAWGERLRQGLRCAVIGFAWLPRDVTRAINLGRCQRVVRPWYAGLALWIVPGVFGLVFLALFAEANPIVESAFDFIDYSALWAVLSEFLTVPRVLFWCIILGLSWPYLHMPKPWAGKAMSLRIRNPIFKRLEGRGLFGQAVLFRSLLLFNALFAVQTCMDLAYLWGGLRLPGNMSYADYAHRGAYPLCVTVLIAAAFVLAASPKSGEAGLPGRLRNLLIFWIGQNVVLVISSLLRLDLYVAAYSLTYWRVAAFIWMGLVGLGLMFLIVKIYGQKGNAWLICVNALTTGVALYLCCFINFSLMIAEYNIAHANVWGVTEQQRLDEHYLLELGVQAVPAIDAHIDACRNRGLDVEHLENSRRALVDGFRSKQRDWRSFGLESWKLERYLDAYSLTEAKRPAGIPVH